MMGKSIAPSNMLIKLSTSMYGTVPVSVKNTFISGLSVTKYSSEVFTKGSLMERERVGYTIGLTLTSMVLVPDNPPCVDVAINVTVSELA